jgi:ketosteroid isomerase-like protein
MDMRRAVLIVMIAVWCGACSAGSQATATAAGDDPGAHHAHEAYVTAINSNNLDTLLGVLTEDVVFLAAGDGWKGSRAAMA